MDLFAKVKAWLGEYDTGAATSFRLERYLGKSTDLADLEHRIKHWDTMTDAEKEKW
jgi:hypothetical protein